MSYIGLLKTLTVLATDLLDGK